MKANRLRSESTNPDSAIHTEQQAAQAVADNTWKRMWKLVRQGKFLQLLEENLSYTIFLTCIGLIYIWNTHHAEKLAIKIEKMENEKKELKSEYMTLNAGLSLSRKQSEIIKIVDSLGLKPLEEPPYKLSIKSASK